MSKEELHRPPNRAERRKIKLNLNDPATAREYLKNMRIAWNGKMRPIFPVKMTDGRKVTAKSATDADIQEILARVAGRKV